MYTLLTKWPGPLGATIITSTYSGGVIYPKCILNPWANANVCPSLKLSFMLSAYTTLWTSSGNKHITISPALVASATLNTSKPSSLALTPDFDPSCNPTTTSTPLSLKFCAWAWPWLPYPSIATFFPFKASMLTSLS